MDTIMIIRDSVAMCVNKMAATCQPCVKDSGTNWQDVIIWVTLFLALAYVIRYGIKQYFKWKNVEKEAENKNTIAKRKNDENDRDWKQKTDLKNKLLDLQKDHAEIKRDEHGNLDTVNKRYDESAYAEYEKTLKTLINNEKLKTIDENNNE